MTPPDPARAGSDAEAVAAAAVPAPGGAGGVPPLHRLQLRADFLRAAAGRRQSTPGFLLQARDRGDSDPAIRVGFTCSKKVGNAVARNRARRRLREIARLTLPAAGRPGWDYVLVGRREATAEADFARMRADLAAALAKLHR